MLLMSSHGRGSSELQCAVTRLITVTSNNIKALYNLINKVRGKRNRNTSEINLLLEGKLKRSNYYVYNSQFVNVSQ